MCCLLTTHFLMLNLLQFLEWGNLEMFVFLSVNRQHIFSCLRKKNTSRFPHSKNCNKFSMRKCVVCSHWGKQTLQGYPILKIVINLAWENVLSVHTEKNKHFKVITIFRMGKPWSVCFSQCEQTTHFLMLNLLQFLEWGNLEVFVFLSVNRHVLSVHTEENKHFKVIPF
jgi:hypothetical protein